MKSIRFRGLFAVLMGMTALGIQAQTVTTFASFPMSLIGPSFISQGKDGNFYGTTYSLFGDALFQLTPSGTLTELAPLKGESHVIPGTDGNFYGATPTGGSGTCFINSNINQGCGTIFVIRPDGSSQTLYSFTGSTDGGAPNPDMIQGSDGAFYGTTQYGGLGCQSASGASGCGTIFRVTPNTQFTTIYHFGATSDPSNPSPPDGAHPVGGLIFGSDRYLYGTTQFGGVMPSQPTACFSAGCGTIFKVSTGGSLTTLYQFPGRPGAALPTSQLVQASDGNFYGVTGAGGTPFPGYGTAFKITPDGNFTLLYTFTTTSPGPGLVEASDGNFYGVGAGGCCGVLYKITPAGTESTVYDFGATAQDGTSPSWLITASDGNLYGTTGAPFGDGGGGANGAGTVFRVAFPPPDTPAINATSGVLNGASFQSGIGAGAWITINGTNLSVKTDTWANAILKGALPTMLDGVSVTVGGQPAYIEYVSPTQINAVAPNVPAGSAAVIVTTAQGASPAAYVEIAAEQPAFFQWGNYAVATRQDFSLAVKNGTFAGTTTVPAKPGDVIILWGTGLGPTSPSAPAGFETPSDKTYNTATPVTVQIGTANATVYGAALAPGYAGLYQIAVQIPAGLANGDYPVVATINGASSPLTTMITVQQ
jgi:uncharacterized protein (TIGR03437 family)